MTETERREYFRVADRLPIEFRLVCDDEYERLEKQIKYTPTQRVDRANEIHFLKRAASKTARENDRIYSYLQAIDRKLDILLDLVASAQKDQIYTRRYVEVNISGAGIRFVSDIHLEKDLFLEVKIVLPFFPFPKITALCKVVRGERKKGEGPPQWQTALKFLMINDEDRDLLINYVFTKEREILRLGKEASG